MSLTIDEGLTESESKTLTARLLAFADRFAPPRNPRDINFAVRDADGALVAGIRCNTVWDWLQIDTLWVTDHLRGQGWGRRLVERAEAAARDLGCGHARLNTFDFEARGFYEKLGYTVAFEIENFPAGHSQFRLVKDL